MPVSNEVKDLDPRTFGRGISAQRFAFVHFPQIARPDDWASMPSIASMASIIGELAAANTSGDIGFFRTGYCQTVTDHLKILTFPAFVVFTDAKDPQVLLGTRTKAELSSFIDRVIRAAPLRETSPAASTPVPVAVPDIPTIDDAAAEATINSLGFALILCTSGTYPGLETTAATINEVAAERSAPGVGFYRFKFVGNEALFSKLQPKINPTIVIFKDGERVDTITDPMSKAEWLACVDRFLNV